MQSSELLSHSMTLELQFLRTSPVRETTRDVGTSLLEGKEECFDCKSFSNHGKAALCVPRNLAGEAILKPICWKAHCLRAIEQEAECLTAAQMSPDKKPTPREDLFKEKSTPEGVSFITLTLTVNTTSQTTNTSNSRRCRLLKTL